MFLLDTDIATLAFRGNARVRDRIARSDPDQVRIPVVTRLEILRGRIDAVLKAADADELRRARAGLLASEAFLAEFPLVPLDDPAIDHFVRLRAERKTSATSRR